MTNTKNTKTALAVIAVLIIVGVLYALLTMPDQRTAGEKLGDAVDALPQGVDKAARQLEDRTPGEKLGDAIKDATDEKK